MKIAIDVSPLSSGHSIRGVGFYLKHLLTALKKYYPEHKYIEFSNSSEIPHDADIIHYPYFDPFSITLPLFKKKNVLITIHDLTPLVLADKFPVGIKGTLFWNVQKYLLKNIGGIITDSVSSKKDIERLTTYSSKQIRSVYLAPGEEFGPIFDKKKRNEVSKKYQLPEKFALYVGDVTPNKNLPNLLKAVLRTKIPLVMVGKSLVDDSVDISHVWAKDIVEVRRLATQHADQIKLLGFVSDTDLPVLYNLASVFVMPSLYEGFGLPVVEAFACGCPVITSCKGSLEEIAGDAAVIIDPYAIEEIAKALQKVVGDTKYAKRLSEKGFLQAKKFSWENTAKETMEAYKKIYHER